MPGLKIGDRRIKYIDEGIKRGLSANAIQRSLKGTPFAVRRTDLLATYRELTNKRRRGYALKHVRKNYRPSSALFPKASFRMKENYMVETTIHYEDKYTGELKSKEISQYFDELKTVSEMEEDIRKEQEPRYGRVFRIDIEIGWSR